MTVKYYTIQTPPPLLPEVESTLTDLCRQSDFVSLPDLIQRFLVSGAHYEEYACAQSLSAEEKEALFEQQDFEDLADSDLVEQKAFIDSVNKSVLGQQKTVDTETKEKPTQSKETAPEQPETAENA